MKSVTLADRFKKTGVLLLVFLLFFGISAGSVLADFPDYPYYEGVMIYEAKSGEVIDAQNENDKYYPASTTKLVTALILMDTVGDRLDEKVTVGEEVNQFGYESSTADIEVGQQLSYEELLYAMLLPSGNDAAETIAVAVGRVLMGDEGSSATWEEAAEVFIAAMNQKAADLGLTGTHFTNPHGLYEADHYTTPAEFAVLVNEAFSYDEIKKVAGTKTYTIKNLDGTDNVLKSSNLFLYTDATDRGSQFVEGSDENPYYTTDITAAKTGLTDEGGRTFAYISEEDGLEIIGILFHSSDNEIFTQSKAQVEEIKGKYSLQSWSDSDGYYEDAKLDNVHFTDGSTVKLSAADEIYTLVTNGEERDIDMKIVWNDDYVNSSTETPRLIAEADEGTQLATLNVSENGSTVKEVALFSDHRVTPKTWADFIVDNLIWIILGVLLLLWYLMIEKPKKDRKNKAQRRSQTSQKSDRSAQQHGTVPQRTNSVRRTQRRSTPSGSTRQSVTTRRRSDQSMK